MTHYYLRGNHTQFWFIARRIIIAIIIAVIIGFWLNWSEKRDEKLNRSFEICQKQYTALQVGGDYITSMQNCMN